MTVTPAWLPNPEPGTAVCVGFKGSESNDWTAIRCETRNGLQFTPRYGPDKRPAIWNPAEWNGEIPRNEVDAAMSEVFDTWRVARAYMDPAAWYSEIGDWAVRFGEDLVAEWPVDKPTRMHPAIVRFKTDLPTRITHDGCPITATHFANCRKVARAGKTYVLGKPADHQKIDAAIASVLAHEAVADTNVAGWPERVSSRMFVY